MMDHASLIGSCIREHVPRPATAVENVCGSISTWEKQAFSARGVQARRKALRIRHINGMEVRKKRPRGFKKRPRGFK